MSIAWLLCRAYLALPVLHAPTISRSGRIIDAAELFFVGEYALPEIPSLGRSDLGGDNLFGNASLRHDFADRGLLNAERHVGGEPVQSAVIAEYIERLRQGVENCSRPRH